MVLAGAGVGLDRIRQRGVLREVGGGVIKVLSQINVERIMGSVEMHSRIYFRVQRLRS